MNAPRNDSLFAALRAAFPGDLDATAIETTAPDGTPLYYTWRDIDRASSRIANLLASLGLPEGSRVAVQVEKSVEAMLLYLATLRAGYVFLPLNTAYQSAEIEYFIGNAEPAVVVCTPGNFGWVSKIAFTAGTRHVFTLGENRDGSLLERAAHHADTHEVARKGPDDLAAILYTSGTTGRSKGAMLTHGNLLSNAVMLNDYWGWRQGDVLIHALPIFHVHGLFVAIHAALLGGSKMIWLAKFDPKAVIAALPRATVFMGVPTLYVRMLGEGALTREAASHMRLFISGSAPLLIETFRDWQERTGHTILERYGMSETIMLTSNPYSADARHGGQDERRGGTVGFPLPGVGLRVVGDDGRELAVGETGHIQVRGANVFKGYWRMPEKTAEEFTRPLAHGDRLEIEARIERVGESSCAFAFAIRGEGEDDPRATGRVVTVCIDLASGERRGFANPDELAAFLLAAGRGAGPPAARRTETGPGDGAVAAPARPGRGTSG